MERIFLSRKNLQALLSKLDRVKAGDHSFCTIIKRDNQHPTMAQSMDECQVTAVENEDYYIDREAGAVFSADAEAANRKAEVNSGVYQGACAPTGCGVQEATPRAGSFRDSRTSCNHPF